MERMSQMRRTVAAMRCDASTVAVYGGNDQWHSRGGTKRLGRSRGAGGAAWRSADAPVRRGAREGSASGRRIPPVGGAARAGGGRVAAMS